MAELLSASSSKKRRAGEEGEGFEAAAAAEQEDRISALPEDLRLGILALLPLNSAIRTGALSTRWRALWARRWPAPSSLDLHIRAGDDPEEMLRSLERRGRRRLDRFSLTIYPFMSNLHPRVTDLQRFLDYAVACGVEDLHIDAADHFVSMHSTFTIPPDCSRLARLFVRHTGRLSFGSCSGTFLSLEVVHLRSVSSVDISILLWACPRLKTLYLRHCDCEGSINLAPAGAHLRSLTVAECNWITHIDASRASGLRSFRLSSASQPCQPQGAHRLQHCSPESLCVGSFWIGYFFDQAELSAELKRVAGLQLVMLEMDITNLAYMYAFFRCCRCPQLERLFVQLPSSSHDILEDNSLEATEEDETDEESSKDHDPDEEEDESVEELYEGCEAEEELLLEQLSEGYVLKERLYHEDIHDDDLPEENEQFEEDAVEDEQSEEDVPEDDQSEEDVPLYDLNNLIFAKLMKFKGHYFEMRLVSFLLRRATGLQKLLLVPPVGVENYMEALGQEPLDTSNFLDTILDFKKASPDAQIVLSDSDPAAIQPVHCDVF
ncbi:unnamed protein product [Urochloa decumbens]|uniref:F-box domain-containing protein n=1 Tax=Urochloa decumbens TaxID=240449 RepID=A0ABC9E384_9POAL